MKLQDFDFDLPPELIANYPASPRDSSKLVRLSREGHISESRFSELDGFIEQGDVLVFNDSKVVPSYFTGKVRDKEVSFNLINLAQNLSTGELEILGKPRKRFIKGEHVIINQELKFFIKEIRDDWVVVIGFDEDAGELLIKMERYGSMPLPPYILKSRGVNEKDKTDYQTIYAKNEGSVAAPTAGLHFTDELLERLKSKGVIIAYVTLHVGAGTFLPIKTDNIEEHKMHTELAQVSRETSVVVNNAKRAGKKIICVGTTSLRTLEAMSDERGELQEGAKSTDIFIKPGYKFKMADRLITNFHLPKSTLLVLVSAFSGMENIKNLYQFALKNELRFYSYGDACMLESA